AIYVADVRVIDVAVDDVSDDLLAASAVRTALDLIAADVRELAEFIQRSAVKLPRVVGGDSLSGQNAIGDGFIQQRCNHDAFVITQNSIGARRGLGRSTPFDNRERLTSASAIRIARRSASRLRSN